MRDGPTVGAEFAGYRLTRELGRGGMGVVYLAESLELQREVALKVLIADLAGQDAFRRRFLREARYAGELDHPNIVPLHDVGEADGFLYIAMEYVDGPDLRTLLARERRLEPEPTASMLTDVASALDAVHAWGMLHRDVKPGNVLVAGFGEGEGTSHCHLTDFGLSKNPTQDSAALTAVDTFVGTLDYVAPELIVAEDVDHRVDVYSLTCLLFECLSGSPPFVRAGPTELMQAHIEDTPPALTGVRPDLPVEIDEIVTRGLAKDPSSRFASCGELMIAAREALGLSPAHLAAGELELSARGAPGLGDVRVTRERVIGRETEEAGLLGDIEISRSHARIWRDSDRTWAIEDLHSTNGTYVNGASIGDRPARLSEGDAVQLGDTTLLVHILPPAGPASSTGAERAPADPAAVSPETSGREPLGHLSLRLEVVHPDEVLLSLGSALPVRLVCEGGCWRVR